MKKRIVVLLLLSIFLFIKNVSARSFNEVHDYEQSFVVYFPKNNTKMIKNFVKITDEEDHPYYDVNPKQTIFKNWDFYEEVEANLTLEQIQSLSKITYFGYGYQNKRTDAYYYATQYLVYQTFKDMSVTYQLKNQNQDDLAPVVEQIKENIKNVTFSLKDFTTKDTTYEIVDPYIIDNFLVQGNHIKVISEDKKIIIQFLDNQKEYVLDFQPKNKCTNPKIWKAGGIELFRRSKVCEQNYQIKVKHQKEEKEEKPIVSISKKEPKKEKNQEFKEVKVPSTGKNEFPYSIVLCLFGAILYVLKK